MICVKRHLAVTANIDDVSVPFLKLGGYGPLNIVKNPTATSCMNFSIFFSECYRATFRAKSVKIDVLIKNRCCHAGFRYSQNSQVRPLW